MESAVNRRSFLKGAVGGAAGGALAAGSTSAAPAQRAPTAQGRGWTGQDPSPSLAAARPELAVVTIGAVEQHSHFLPVGTDTLNVTALGRAVAERLQAYFLPVVPFGNSREHIQSAMGTITLSPMTLQALIVDVVACLYHQGFTRVALLTGHGGNFIMEPTVAELNLRYPDRIVVMGRPVASSSARGPGIWQSTGSEIHVSESETSTALHNFPEHVTDGPRVDYRPPGGSRELFDFAFVDDFSPSGGWGTPSLGTAEKGRIAFEQAVEGYVRGIPALFDQVETLRRG